MSLSEPNPLTGLIGVKVKAADGWVVVPHSLAEYVALRGGVDMDAAEQMTAPIELEDDEEVPLSHRELVRDLWWIGAVAFLIVVILALVMT